MICRWCGAKLDSRQQRCPACGRETPPLSDCGGFPGLSSHAPAGAGAGSGQQSAPPPAQGDGGVPRPSEGGCSDRGGGSRVQQKRRKAPLQGIVGLCALAAMLVAVIVMWANLAGCRQEVNDLKLQVDGLQEELKATQHEISGLVYALGEDTETLR